MNPIKQLQQRKAVAGLFFLFALSLLTGCVSKTDFLISPVVPAARGFVKVNTDDNKNYVIHLRVDNLAEVARLQPPRQTYVVWLVTDTDMSKNIGQLHSDTKTMSKNLSAHFETVSSYEPKRIFITAEQDGTTSYPDDEIILSTGIIHK